MFALADLITIEVLNAGIENLRNNPHHLEYILRGYHQSPFLKKIHGSQYIRQFKEWLKNNSIKIQPYYALDTNILPNITVTATYDESTTFFGDYGNTCKDEITDGDCVADFDAIAISADKMEMYVYNSYNLTSSLLPGMILKNVDYEGKIEYITSDVESGLTTIRSTSELPRVLGGWRAEISAPIRKVTVNSSLNQVTVFVKVKSSGDVELHKLLCMLTRYCLKYGRMNFENLGLMKSHFGQGMMVLEDPDQSIYASSFTITGEIGDWWIISEDEVPTSYNIVSLEAVRECSQSTDPSTVLLDKWP
jgi:hypothetical protein